MARGERDDERHRHAATRPAWRRTLRSLLAFVLIAAGVGVGGIALYRSTRGTSTAQAPHPTTSPSGSPSSTSASPSVSPAPSATTASASPSVGPTALWQQTLPSASALLSPQAGPRAAATLPTTAGLVEVLTPLLADKALAGDGLAVVVSDAATGRSLFDHRGSDAVLPASTAKLAVAVAALQVLGPDHTFATKVVSGPDPDDVVLVGGGDPTLAGPNAVGTLGPGYPSPARLSDLASTTASALKASGVTTVNVGYDASLFTGPATAAGWKPLYLTEGDVAAVSALEVDEGRTDLSKPGRSADPAGVAAADFAALLTADGLTVSGAPKPTKADGGATLATVSSPPVSGLVQRMLGRSDNDLAEALARQVALAGGLPATFTGGAQAVRAAAVGLGVPSSGLAMVDGSGLSPLDRATPAALAQLVGLGVGTAHPRLASLLAALPVAGFSGTLANRFTGPAASADGLVRAKTGTLDGVASLAGYLDDASGAALVFVVVANGVALNATAVTEAALDRVVAGLVGCGCG